MNSAASKVMGRTGPGRAGARSAASGKAAAQAWNRGLARRRSRTASPRSSTDVPGPAAFPPRRPGEAGADAESKNLLVEEMRGPPDTDALARDARTPELAAKVYAASLLAIDVDTQAERDYLQRLASALRLDADTVRRLHFAVGAPG